MQIYAIQFDIAWQDPDANFDKIRHLLSTIDLAGGALLVLPEMFATGFSMNTHQVVETLEGPTCRFLSDLAVTTACQVIAGVAIDGPRGPHNEALMVSSDGTLVHRYAKRHLFSYAHEDRHYRPGSNLITFTVDDTICSTHICYDLRFPEDFRTVTLRGAELLVVIANWPSARHAHWTTLLAARAIENQAYVLGVNRVGSDPTQHYAGDTCLFDPRGSLVASAETQQGILHAELNLQELRDFRRDFPTLNDVLP